MLDLKYTLVQLSVLLGSGTILGLKDTEDKNLVRLLKKI